MSEIVTPEHYSLAGQMRDILASYLKAEDLINIGAYQKRQQPSS